jgi:transposase
MHALVHAADIQDRDGGVVVMTTLFGLYPFLLKLYADGGYQGQAFQQGVKKAIARVNVEIVKRSDQARGFVVLPKRRIVERTFAWLGCCRRLAKDWAWPKTGPGQRLGLAKDWECLNAKALAFLKLASIRLMIRRFCNPP